MVQEIAKQNNNPALPNRPSLEKHKNVTEAREKSSPEQQRELNNKLLKAAKKGYCAEIKRLIKAGADIAATDDFSWTALHGAAYYGYIQTCALLLDECMEAGGNVKELIEKPNNVGGTALHSAAFSGRTETCIFLLKIYAEQGGNVKELIEKSDTGWTAVNEAAQNGHTETCALLLKEYKKAGGNVKYLLLVKAPVNITDYEITDDPEYEKMTALQIAKNEKHAGTAEFLRLAEIMELNEFNSFWINFSKCISGGG
jgi:ankyrin repeat protein